MTDFNSSGLQSPQQGKHKTNALQRKKLLYFITQEQKRILWKNLPQKRGEGERQEEKKYLQFILQRVNCVNIQRALTNQ